MNRLLRACCLGFFLIVSVGCGASAPEEDAVLISLTDSIIVPEYEALAAESNNLRKSLEDLCAAPSDAALIEARQAWRKARAPWMRAEAAWFGPVMDRRSVSLMDWSPIDAERIETMLTDRPATTEDEVRNVLSSTQRGFGAIEYLLFDEDALQQLSGSRTARCDYLTALGLVVESEATAINHDWSVAREHGPAYKDFFTGRSDSSLLTRQAVAELVRTQVFLIRTIVDMRLASALGLREGGPDPTAIPGGAGDNTLDDLRNEILGMRSMYIGSDGEDGLGISDLVLVLSEDTDERMRNEFEASLSAIDAVGMPLKSALDREPERVRLVYDRLVDLQRTLSVEVVSLLGVSIGFSDTDGDSLR